MKFVALHKSKPKQISISMTFCALQILVLVCLGQGLEQIKQPGLVAIGQSLTLDHPDASFVESLIKTGLYDVAIETCRDRYRMAVGIQSEAAAQWSLLEMQSVAAKAAANPSIIDDPASAVKLLEANQEILDRSAESSRFYWLKQQQQWCRWHVLRRMQTAYIAVPARKAIREWSLATIRDCLEELEALQLLVYKAPVRGKSTNKLDPTTEQWSSLTNEIFLLQTDFLLLRVLYYPAKSTERIAAATEMTTAIDKAELRINEGWAGKPNMELARYTAWIHLERPAEALKGIKSLNQRLIQSIDGKPKQTSRWALRIASLAAEACRNLGNIDESNQWLKSVGGWTVAPEIAIEHFANLVAAPKGQATSESQLTRAMQVKNEIGIKFGSYWQQRADAILVANDLFGSNESTTSIQNSSLLKVELLRTEAKQLSSAKRWDEAIEKLSQAELSAASAGNEAISLDVAIEAAAVLFAIGRKELSECEFHRAAISYSKQPKAPDAAIMSIWSFDQAIRVDANASGLNPTEEAAARKQQIYRGRLMDILNTWPNTPQADVAFAKLDRLYLLTDQLSDLLSLWSKRLDITKKSALDFEPNPKPWSDYDQALSRLALVSTATQDAWYDHSIYVSETMRKLQPSLHELRTKLLEKAAPIDRVAVQSILSAISEAGRWPASVAGATNFQSNSVSYSPAVSLLSQVIAGMPSTFLPDDAQPASNIAMVWSTAELEFQRIIGNGTRKSNDQTELANLQLVVDRLSGFERQEKKLLLGSIGPSQSIQFGRSMQLYRAAIQCWSGDLDVGQAAFKVAIASEPTSPWWSYRTARVFQTLSGRREQAIQQFRQLAKGFPTGSEAWLEARARTVQTMRSMGDIIRAKELTDIVFATYPGAVSEWHSRFDQ